MEEEKDKFGRPYPKAKLVPFTAADAIVLRGEGNNRDILLITRKKPGPS